MNLVQPPFALQKTVVAHFSNDSSSIDAEFEYILDCSKSIDQSTCAVALSNNMIQLRDSNTLDFVNEFKGHESTIQEIQFSVKHPHMLFSCSSDRTTKIWDLRVRGCAQSFTCEDEIWSHSFGCDETLLATGTDEMVNFFDVRSGRKLGQYEESHVDAVTKVRFHPVLQTHLVTASEDGIVCLFDCTISKEADAIVSIINAESSVSQIGFFGPKLEGVFCLTGTETVDIWSLETAERIVHFPNIREVLTSMKFPVDYLVNCQYDKDLKKLHLLAGDQSGTLHLLDIQNNNIHHIDTLQGGHTACVRSFYWDNDSLITVGEDSRICMWKPKSQSLTQGPNSVRSSYKLDSKHSNNRVKPY